jgi:hypothetical protein
VTRPDLAAVRMVEAYLPVSREVLADALDLQAALVAEANRPRAEREAMAEQRRAASDARRAEVEAQHRGVVEQLDGRLLAIADHHRPHVPELQLTAECHGCDVAGYEWEYPEWPCSTYTLASAAT